MYDVIDAYEVLQLQTRDDILSWMSHYAAELCYNIMLSDAERIYLSLTETKEMSLLDAFEEVNRDYRICLRHMDRLSGEVFASDESQHAISFMPDLLDFANMWNQYQVKWRKFEEDFFLLFFSS